MEDDRRRRARRFHPRRLGASDARYLVVGRATRIRRALRRDSQRSALRLDPPSRLDQNTGVDARFSGQPLMAEDARELGVGAPERAQEAAVDRLLQTDRGAGIAVVVAQELRGGKL